MSNSKQLSLLLFLIMAVGFTGWWLLHHQQQANTARNFANNPDSIADNITIINMDEEGKPTAQFTATKMVHYPSQNTSIATAPNLIIYVKGENPWHITAAHGKATNGDTTIHLWEDVKFHQAASTEKPESIILTEAFTFWPKRKFGETDQLITMLQPGVKVTAIGLTADTVTGKVNLLKDVRGNYVSQT